MSILTKRAKEFLDHNWIHDQDIQTKAGEVELSEVLSRFQIYLAVKDVKNKNTFEFDKIEITEEDIRKKFPNKRLSSNLARQEGAEWALKEIMNRMKS